MKRKLTAILLVILCTFFLIKPMTVSAADSQVFQGTGTSTITYWEQSTYCVLIPEYIDMNAGLYTFQAEHLNIAEVEKVYVTVTNLNENNRLLFTHESGEYTLTKNLEIYPSNESESVPSYMPPNCVGYFSGDDTTSKISFGLSFDSYEYTRIRAGMYSATVEFCVDLGN